MSIASLLLIIISQTSVLADSNYAGRTSELSASTVVTYFAILLLAILLPVFKGSSNRTANLK